MTAVQRGELGLAEAFDDGEDGGIDEADPGVRIAVNQVADSNIIFSLEILDNVRALDQVVNKRALCYGATIGREPVVEFGQDRGGNK